MTGHYRLEIPTAHIASLFCADPGPDPWVGGAITPGQFAPVIAQGGRHGKRIIRPMHWGYPPPGTSTEAMGPAAPRWVAQVRNLESPFWIGNLRHSQLRCLIPATAFSVRHSNHSDWFGVKNASAFAMAGIWRDLTDMPVFAILTTEPNSALLPVEGGKKPAAMPLILAAADQDRWLREDWKTGKGLVRPFPAHETVLLSDI